MIIALIILSILLILATILTLICYFKTFYNGKFSNDPYTFPKGEAYIKHKNKLHSLIKSMEQIPFEQVYILSNDNIKLAARYYHIQDNAPIHIQCHGYKGCAIRDFSGGTQLVHKLKHNTLTIDQRAHGKSGGVNITFGINESDDILCWINYCIQRFGKDVKLVLSGVSMGAASVLMCAGMELPNNVKAIFADSPYSSPKDIICKVIKQMKLPPKIIYPFEYLAAFIFGRFKLNKKSAINALKNNKIPVLIIHGENDSIVPCEMSKTIKEINPSIIKLHTFKNAEHGLSFIEDYDRYEKTIMNFLTDLGL